MRRVVALFVISLFAGLALAACSSSAPPSPNASVTAKGSFGSSPSVTIPKQEPTGTLAVKTLIQGTGPTITKSDLFLSNFTIYVWSGTTNKLLDSTYSSSPQVLPASLLPGIQSAVTGKKVGSRVLVVVPPKQGYGTSGNSQLGVTGSDTLVFVMDLIQKYSSGTVSASGTKVSSGGGDLPTVSAAQGSAPKVTIPKGVTPPTTLVSKTLIKGSGPVVTKGEYLVAQYTGVNWRTGSVFAAAGIALFAAYIRLSATYPVNSDGANIVLMAWDMLHGNLVLHNWWMSDVSFYTTELPEYVLIDAIRAAGQGPGQLPRGPGPCPAFRRHHAGSAAGRGHLRAAAVGRAHRHRRARPGRVAAAGSEPPALVHPGHRRGHAGLGDDRRFAGARGGDRAAGHRGRVPRGAAAGHGPAR
jgi:peptidylprolyl isomerase